MSQPSPTRAGVKTAAEVCTRFELGDASRALLDPSMLPRQFLDRLREAALYADATKLVAHTLPKRQAVWWACLCLAEALGADPLPESAAALEASRAWVAEPNDGNRRKAYAAAQAVGFDTAAGCVALAVFFSGGSLSPPDLPVTPPADHLTGTMLAAAVALAVVLDAPEEAPRKYDKALQTAIEVADGKLLWPGARKS